MAKPFRFAVQISALPADGWIERVRSFERLGYSTVFGDNASSLNPNGDLYSLLRRR